MKELTEVPATLDRIFGALNHVHAITDAAIGRIPDMTDEELKAAHVYVTEVGQSAWRLADALYAEITKRAKERAWQRDGEGARATISKVAAELGIETRTLYEGAQRHNTFTEENCAGARTVLAEKQFFTEALRAPDPVAAIELMAAKKAENPFYSSRDARADVMDMKRPGESGTPPLPEGTYSLILADPPWRYEFAQSDTREIENHYPTMELLEICALPVPSMCADDCTLFLWATSPKLAESIAVVEAWGFTYKTCMVWVKDKIGMGYYARQQHELLLVATKGNPSVPEPSNRPPSVITADRTRHSAKPEVFRETIERMYPNAKKVELFCRSPRTGWDAWGNEV